MPGGVAANSVRIMSVIAIGGMGKSALTWKWFEEVAPEEMKPLAGRIWWSFYESDATFENFVIRSLAYVSKRGIDEVQEIPVPERESQLLVALNHEPFLIVLDGLERILIAYARMDAARLDDSDVGKERGLRKTEDPRVGSFLKKLAQVRYSRILVSSRLYPTELETDGSDPIPGTFKLRIEGLTDEDAVELWRAFGVSGARDELLVVFTTFGKHPLLIQALAGEVKRYRKAPGNFEEWRRANPRFDPARFPTLQDAMGHVLEFALRGLDDRARRVLQTIAAFRMPATYDTLTALLVGKSKTRFELSTGTLISEEGRLFAEETQLDAVLTELEDRGLLGWDQRANRYDLHPIVRGVVWTGLGEDTRRGVYTSLHAHFEALPKIDDWTSVNAFEDLTPAIELYSTLIGLGQYDDALRLFYERLQNATIYRLSANRQLVELMEMLFPDGVERLPSLNSPDAQAVTFALLAIGYKASGQPGRAVPFYRYQITTRLESNDPRNASKGLSNLSEALRLSGDLRESESAARRAFVIARTQIVDFLESTCLNRVGLALAARGVVRDSESALKRSLRIDMALSNNQAEGYDNSELAQRGLWLGEFAAALSFANDAWGLAHVQNLEADFIRAARVQGEAALGLNDLVTADEWLHHALTRARTVNLVEEELPSLVALAELRRRQGDVKAARELLDDV